MDNPHKNQPGLMHVWRAVGIALQGVRAAWVHEDAFRQEVVVAMVAIPVALFYGVSIVGKALLLICIFLVLVVELLNSALEAAVDHASLAHHPLAKRAKDIASAAVLMSIVNAVVIWALILFAG